MSQSSATVLTGKVTERAKSAAAGLYVTFYYAGGFIGTIVTGWFWMMGGWHACVAALAAVGVLTLLLAFLGSSPREAVKADADSMVDTAI
jgi:MFS family permease